MKVVGITNLRQNIKTFFQGVSKDNDILLIPMKKDEKGIVIMSLDKYNQLSSNK